MLIKFIDFYCKYPKFPSIILTLSSSLTTRYITRCSRQTRLNHRYHVLPPQTVKIIKK